MLEIQNNTYVRKQFSNFFSGVLNGNSGIVTNQNAPVAVFVNMERYLTLPPELRSPVGHTPNSFPGGFEEAFYLWRDNMNMTPEQSEKVTHLYKQSLIEFDIPEEDDAARKAAKTFLLLASARHTQTRLQHVLVAAGQGFDTIVTRFKVPSAVIISPLKFGRIPGALQEIKDYDPSIVHIFMKKRGIKKIIKKQPAVRMKDGKPINDFHAAFLVWRGDRKQEE